MTDPARATHRPRRQSNPRLVRTLYDDGPVSRAEVARRTGITDTTRSTVSDVVGNLIIQDAMAEGTRTHVCKHSVPPDSLEALGSALLGRLEPSGTLAVPLDDVYPVGYGR